MGTRPEAIKMAPVVAKIRAAEDLEPLVINSGQHREMIQQVIDLFELSIDVELKVMRPDQTLAGLTARLVDAISGTLAAHRPDYVLVQAKDADTARTTLSNAGHRIIDHEPSH